MLDISLYQNVKKYKKYKMPYIPRDLSWIDFNRRVLGCSNDNKIPINERANFIGITESNLDEFISVRYPTSNEEGEDLKEKILKEIKRFINDRDEVVKNFLGVLHNKFNISFTTPSRLSKKEFDRLEKVYHEEIFPLMSVERLSDYKIDNGYPFIAAIVKDKDGSIDTFVIPILKELNDLYITGDGKNVLTVDDIIIHFLQSYTFINKEVKECGVFRIIQDGSIILSHDTSKGIIERMEDTLLVRSNANPIILQYRENSADGVRNVVSNYFGINKKHTIKRFMIDYKVFKGINLIKDGNYKKFKSRKLPDYETFYLFDTLDKKDLFLHHPYDSYNTVVEFIRQASTDKYVIAIKQTLYRVSSIDSPIVDALCRASKNGKKVIVLVEIKARFDERNNIEVYKKLTDAGCSVILGDEYKKTHCKMSVVVRRKPNEGTRVYSHIGTGNYNETTAKVYTDISYMTSNNKIGHDLVEIFNILSGSTKPDASLNKIFFSPVNLRRKLIDCIDKEIKIAKTGKKAEIIFKINSISDKEVISKLYQAADKGVKVTVIARGICSIIPRKNLEVKSIVGRFLEHSRIYYFRNKKQHDYYISSADLLPRNLDKRVELLIYMKDESLESSLSKIISMMKNDTANSFIEDKTGKWYKSDKAKTFNCHEEFINNLRG